MIIIPALVVVLGNALLEIPPSGSKIIDLPISRHGTFIECSFDVRKGSRVQVMLADRVQAERFHRGRSIRPAYATGFENKGRFRYRVPDAGHYVLIVDNRMEGRGPTQLLLSLDVSLPPSVTAQELPPERRRAVVALSVFFFGAVVAFSARQYLRHS